MSNVPSINLADLSPSDFTDQELDLPYHLAHFKQFADAVLLDGPDRGFINISVWRRPQDNVPHNARIMENCLALIFFYCTNRPWNVYYNHPAIKERLEAALIFWCNNQSPDGQFSEYGSNKWNLAATAFATKFMGQGLQLLHNNPTIDPDLHKRAIETVRKALYATFTDEAFQTHGKSFTNQYANAWGGALAYLNLYPDPEIESLLDQRLEESLTNFQSPVGYFYEKDGPDWGYFFGTHHSDIHAAWHYTHNTDRAKYFIEKEQRWYDWLSYNAVREPDHSGFTLNRAIETRQKTTFLEEYRTNLGGPELKTSGNLHTTALGTHADLARAFGRTTSDCEQDTQDARKRLEANWPNVPTLAIGEFWAYTPYTFLHRTHIGWNPSTEQKETTTAQLPYIARDHFTHQRADNRHPVVFTYIRRPTYYAAFTTGHILSPQQRYGLGLLFHPQIGTVLQSQTNTTDAAWGTLFNDTLYETNNLQAQFQINNTPITPQTGAHDLSNRDLEITYPLGENGHKTARFTNTTIEVTVQHTGTFTEIIPLLKKSSDTLQTNTNQLTLKRDNVTLTIASNSPITTQETEYISGNNIVVTAQINAKDNLAYTIKFS
ncbi:MAG: hypothetical protein ACI8V2_002114 [Candidatus Latescibacterota bacterium]|jgi:hypothetical protein